jgi:xanthine dehydrogenase YagS FAD-binding subunit
MAVALLALDAVVFTRTRAGERRIALADLHRLPGDRPDLDTTLEPGELITAIELPPPAAAARSTYRKVRDRSSYAFALVSVAAALRIEDGRIADLRIALGGVAHRPWRASRAEAVLRGGPIGSIAFAAAADAELAQAQGLKDNGFKIELARRTIVAVLDDLTGDAA